MDGSHALSPESRGIAPENEAFSDNAYGMHRAFALRALARFEHGLPVQRRDAHAQHAPVVH